MPESTKTAWHPLPPKAFSEPPKDLTHILETRRHRKRMMTLGMLAAVPGIVVLVGLVIWGISALHQARQNQLVISTYKTAVTEYLATARQAVAAWPDDGETLVRIQSGLLPMYKALPPLPEGQKWIEFKNKLRDMSVCLIKPAMFFENQHEEEEQTHRTEAATQFAAKLKAENMALDRKVANHEIRMASDLLNKLEHELTN